MSPAVAGARKALLVQAAVYVLGAWRAFSSPTWLAVTFLLAAAAVALGLLLKPTAPMRLLLVGYEVVAIALGLAGFFAGHYVLGTIPAVYVLLEMVRTSREEFTATPDPYDDSAADHPLGDPLAQPQVVTGAPPWAQPAPQPFPGHAVSLPPVPGQPAAPQPVPAQPFAPPQPSAPPLPVAAQPFAPPSPLPAPPLPPLGVHDPALGTPAGLAQSAVPAWTPSAAVAAPAPSPVVPPAAVDL